jgi:hypothetical protein
MCAQDGSQVSPLAPKPHRSPTKAARHQVGQPPQEGRAHPQLSALAQSLSRVTTSTLVQGRDAGNIFAGNRYVVSGIPEKLRCAFDVFWVLAGLRDAGYNHLRSLHYA